MTRVIRFHEYGSADVLCIEDIEVPAPAGDEVQIAVRASGLNRAEVMFRNGAYLQEANFLAARVNEITSGKGARVLFDPIGGPAIARLAEVMAVGGILLEYGALSPDEGAFPQFAVLGKSLSLKGYLYPEIVSDDDALARSKAFITEGLESGKLDPLVSDVPVRSDPGGDPLP